MPPLQDKQAAGSCGRPHGVCGLSTIPAHSVSGRCLHRSRTLHFICSKYYTASDSYYHSYCILPGVLLLHCIIMQLSVDMAKHGIIVYVVPFHVVVIIIQRTRSSLIVA